MADAIAHQPQVIQLPFTRLERAFCLRALRFGARHRPSAEQIEAGPSL